MIRRNRKTLILLSLLVPTGLLLGTSGVIYIISTNRVSNDDPFPHERWEPSSAAGTTWTTSWQDLYQGSSYVSAWNGGSWASGQLLSPPNSFGSVDVNLGWDSVRSHFVFATLADEFEGGSIWYGWSDAYGSSWIFGPTPAFSSVYNQVRWDYPSIGIDATGRVIIGAVKYVCVPPSCSDLTSQGTAVGYFTVVSTDGVSFSAPSYVAGPGVAPGAHSRVVAAGSLFHAFIPTLSGDPKAPLPTLIRRYQSSDGVNWSGPLSIGMDDFSPPNNNTPPGYSPTLFYAPLLAASGYTNGLWSVAFQAKQGQWNNVILCTSDRGCVFVNYADDDEFLAGASVSGDSGYWVSYLAYSTLETRQLPLISQTLYFPPGQSAIYVNYYWVDPTGWTKSQSLRCPGVSECLGAGDFATIASNPYAGATTPFVTRSANNPNVLFQNFLQDPPAPPNFKNSPPNVVPIPYGANISSLGTPVPTEARGFDPATRHLQEKSFASSC